MPAKKLAAGHLGPLGALHMTHHLLLPKQMTDIFDILLQYAHRFDDNAFAVAINIAL